MNGYYILEGKKAVRVDNVIEWATQFESQDRTVAKDTINGFA